MTPNRRCWFDDWCTAWAIDIACIDEICQAHQIWYSQVERRQYLYMDAIGIGTRIQTASLPDGRNHVWSSGSPNSRATGSEMRKTNVCCEKWDGMFLLYGNVNSAIRKN